MNEPAPLPPPSSGDRPADTEGERTLLHRIVGGLGLRLVVLGSDHRLVVGNQSMSLSSDEHAILVTMIRGDHRSTER